MKWDGEWHITYETFRDMGIAFAVALLLIYLSRGRIHPAVLWPSATDCFGVTGVSRSSRRSGTITSPLQLPIVIEIHSRPRECREKAS